MPWTSKDAYRHTKAASTPHLQRQWANVANSALASGDDEASAIRQANSVVGGASKQRPKTKASKPKAAKPATQKRTHYDE